MSTSELITLAIAVWGAVLSTVLAVWNIWRDRREDGRLRIRVFVGKIVGGDSIKPFCIFEVVNVGRRTMYFNGLYLHDRKGKFLAQVLGQTEEGAYERLEPNDIRENVDPNGTFTDAIAALNTRKVFAVHSRGKTYMAKWRLVRMHRQIRKVQAEQRAMSRKRLQTA